MAYIAYPMAKAHPPLLAPDTGDLIGMVSYIDVLRAVRPFFDRA